MNKKSKVIVTTLILIIGALLCFCSYLVYDKLNNDIENNDDNVLKVYLDNHRYTEKRDSMSCYFDECHYIEDTLNIPVKNKNAKLIASYYSSADFGYVLYYDSGLILYDIDTTKTKKVVLDMAQASILDMSYITFESGFIYNDTQGNCGYYNIENNTIYFKNEYRELKSIDGTSDYLAAFGNDSVKIIDIYTGNILIKIELDKYYYDSDSFMEFEYHKLGNKQFFVEENYAGDYFLVGYIIYDETGKIIAKLNADERYEFEQEGQNFTENNLVIYKKDRKYLIK